MLKDKVAVITGSVRGIGRAIAMCFAKQGANVVINYSSEKRKEEADQVVTEIKALGGKAIALCANVANSEEAKGLIEGTIAAFGKIDILVNNAGITKDMLLLRMTEKEFQEVLDVNLKGVFNCSKHGAKAMMKTGGSIINMTSVVGINGNAGQSNYAASKAGVIGFTKSVAKEFAGKNIRVNAIAPGFITTDMTDILPERVKESVMTSIPMKCFGVSEEIANVAVFLASDLSSYITGEVIKVDGGMAM
ncbi:3-oxoacyl-[acyl-carrier-protein] reductase [Cellulosilyticum lentocellum]|uniref:3-oxoacyl-[acyl-carrier-protein] reductase n=1 Tax=Cellulosilyticum lentocellum (strain ATCC 49066 / DSM 5427 / NCIMB 11756 / RHM5) TaxID=642492 RepID=F2JNH1_CELLD|nr:3-oxoacyl-[acyl-carrier-protein] reductase [Cellulosilyticum lentocellum]ADZ84747.1 3-oxoacyl-(acyl-carrier-protein) reductase [Cellulosilyticum lentocellum DSM 5427]